MNDPGCGWTGDGDEWNDWDAAYRSASGASPPQLEYEQWACGVTAAQEGQWYSYQTAAYCPATTSRCTKKVWTWKWWDAIGDAFKLRTTIEVCYRHNNGIVTVLKRYDEALSTRAPWGYVGRVTGYPLHYRYAKYVDFHFRNRLSFCLLWKGCFPEKEPWLVIRFYDTNTMTWESGIA
jgi:hypothetical protein